MLKMIEIQTWLQAYEPNNVERSHIMLIQDTLLNYHRYRRAINLVLIKLVILIASSFALKFILFRNRPRYLSYIVM